MTFREWFNDIAKGDRIAASQALGITRVTLWKWLAGKSWPHERDRARFSLRTGTHVPPEGFAPGEVNR